MRVTEFVIVDGIKEINEQFEFGYNEYLRESNLVFEATAETDEVLEFVRSYANPGTVGGKYFIDVLRLSDMSGHKYASVAMIKNQCQLLDISSTHITVKDVVSGQIKRLPEIPGPVFDKTTASILFDNPHEQQYFLTMFATRFGHWKLDIKEL